MHLAYRSQGSSNGYQADNQDLLRVRDEKLMKIYEW